MAVSGNPSAAEPRRASPVVRAARRRADRVKVAAAVVAAVLFIGGLGVTRRSYASHAKHHARALAAPSRFERIVQHDTQGIVAPAQAPAASQTATS